MFWYNDHSMTHMHASKEHAEAFCTPCLAHFRTHPELLFLGHLQPADFKAMWAHVIDEGTV